MPRLTDTHCHLDFPNYQDDLEAVLDRAREAGVERFLIPGIDLDSCEKALEIAGRHLDVFAAIGLHPNQADAWGPDTLKKLEALAHADEVVAIGEIGLDYYRMRSSPEVQQKIFRSQLELAARLSLPVVIHNREATQPVIQILSEWHADLVEFGSDLADRAGVLHSYSGTLETAENARPIGFSIGITGPVTFKKADELRQVVADISLDQLLIETDSPFLTPTPNRGKRNEPGYVRYVAEKIAELHETTLDVISQKTFENAERLFLW